MEQKTTSWGNGAFICPFIKFWRVCSGSARTPDLRPGLVGPWVTRQSCASISHFTCRTGATEGTLPRGFERDDDQGRKGWLAAWRVPKAFTAPSPLAMSCSPSAAHAQDSMHQEWKRPPIGVHWSWCICAVVHQHVVYLLWGQCWERSGTALCPLPTHPSLHPLGH